MSRRQRRLEREVILKVRQLLANRSTVATLSWDRKMRELYVALRKLDRVQ